jgi:hypothetical protein
MCSDTKFMGKSMLYSTKRIILKIFFRFGKPGVPIIIALILLVYTIFLVIQNQSYANEIMTYAYYLLIIGAFWQLIHYFKERAMNNNHGKE